MSSCILLGGIFLYSAFAEDLVIVSANYPPLLVVSLAGHESSETFPDLNLDEPDDEGAELS